MKRSLLLLIMALMLSLTLQLNSFKAKALDADITYAYLPTSVMLYSKTADGVFSPLTQLPSTYFVALLQDIDSVSDYIMVSYADIIGYVKKADIEPCDYEPVTKSKLGSAKVSFDNQGANLRLTPEHSNSDNIIEVIPSSATVEYYGTVDGSAIFEQLGNKWYYVKYTVDDKTVRGYIYSAQLLVERIEANVIQKVPPITPPDSEPEINDPPDTLNDTTIYVIIACLMIPAVLIMLLLFQKPSATKRKPRHL